MDSYGCIGACFGGGGAGGAVAMHTRAERHASMQYKIHSSMTHEPYAPGGEAGGAGAGAGHARVGEGSMSIAAGAASCAPGASSLARTLAHARAALLGAAAGIAAWSKLPPPPVGCGAAGGGFQSSTPCASRSGCPLKLLSTPCCTIAPVHSGPCR